ncbi:codanin-1 isoform X2 [Osmerus eperlanus]|uniref:codanin-1 isoform X2 n=1 Tax=Osmerus eperlanus TaxID=29151 RepID=UPI002E136D36
MAALLESLLLQKVETRKAVEWLKDATSDSLSSSELHVTADRQEFVPFLLNFLREQSNHALTHGPATPAKTPSRPRSLLPQDPPSERGRSTGAGSGSRSASRVQLFLPAPSISPQGGAEWDATSLSGSLNQSAFSALSSPSFSSTWSPASRPCPSERRPAQRGVSLGDFMASSPELQPSPNLQRGRRRTPGMGGGPQGRHGGGRGYPVEEGGRWEGGGRRSRGGGASRVSEQVSPPTVEPLNFNSLEDFPPVGVSRTSPPPSKPSRRIKPTPVSVERPHSRPKSCFTSTPISKAPSPTPGSEPATGAPALGSPLSLQEEREMLKREKCKRAQQTCLLPSTLPPTPDPCTSTLPPTLDPCTPTKTGLRAEAKVTPDTQAACPEPSKVTLAFELGLLAELYCTCICENLVPNVFVELFFLLQLLTSRTPVAPEEEEEEPSVCVLKPDVLERGYLRKVHNCVFFSVRVLENLFDLLAHLDRVTLRLLAENERLACFSPALRDRLTLAQDSSTAKVSPTVSPFIHSVPFQPATDNRSNFSSDKAFHIFKKQRDIFYELLREWEDFHKEPGWAFEPALGSRVRGMVSQLTVAGNHAHFARLFLKQLVQMCKGPCASGSPGDAPDPDLLGMLGADGLGRLKRLQERLIQPQGILGPCPPPSFPGHEEFFRDFLQTASCCQLNQHLKDSLCQQLLQLDQVSILAPSPPSGGAGGGGEGDMEQQDEKQRFSSVLLLARLLAKFLGLLSFLSYQASESPSREALEAAVAVRSKSAPVLDVCAVLRSSVKRRRTVLTVPWLVEFLSMLDHSAPYLPCYRTALGLLRLLYRRMALVQAEEVCYHNQLLMVAVMGWLFQIPVIPEELFFTRDFTEEAQLEESNTSAPGLDCLPLVDQQLLYTCCPFLGEFRKLLAAFVAGSSSRSGGLIRKITPTSAEPRGTPAPPRSQQKLQVDLEQAFFHNQPPSLRRTVEFVSERVGSNCVKHIKATLVCELVQRGENMLREGLASPDTSAAKLNDSICAHLCDAGMQALERAARFCSVKSPEAIRVLLPEETSSAVLTTSETITKHLATEKATSWLSSNITALIKREWKSRMDAVVKSLPSPPPPEAGRGAPEQPPSTAPSRARQGGQAGVSCPAECLHAAPLPSDVLVEIKEVLSIAVGPRCEGEQLTGALLTALLERVADTLTCRKYLSPVPEQMLLRCTVLLACKLVCGDLPLYSVQQSGSDPASAERAALEQVCELWRKDCCSSAPLHLLFSELALSATLSAGHTQWNHFLFLVTCLMEKGLMGEEEVISHWRKLSTLPWPVEYREKVHEQLSSSSSPLREQHAQASQQPLEGAN